VATGAGKHFLVDEDHAEHCRFPGAARGRCGTTIWAYWLMPSHVHLVLVPSRGDGLRCALGEAHCGYTRMIKFRQDGRGNLWQERFHAFVMDELHLLAAARYSERNPVRAALCRKVGQSPCSSARAHLCGEDDDLARVVRPLLDLMPDRATSVADDEAHLPSSVRGLTSGSVRDWM
jgi:putative transposase